MLAQARKQAKGSKVSKPQREQATNAVTGHAQQEAVPSQSRYSMHDRSIGSTSLASQEPDELALTDHLQTASSLAGPISQAEEASTAQAEAVDIDQVLLDQLLGGMALSQSAPPGLVSENAEDGSGNGAMPQIEADQHQLAGCSLPGTKRCNRSGQPQTVPAQRDPLGEAVTCLSNNKRDHDKGVGVALIGRKGAAPAMLRMLQCPLSQVSWQRGLSPALRCIQVACSSNRGQQ